jgi:hypothetical protein
MNLFVLFIYNLLIHLINDISHLIKLSFNTPKSTKSLDALSHSKAGSQHIASMIDFSSSQIMLDNPKVKNLDGCTICPIVHSIESSIWLTP